MSAPFVNIHVKRASPRRSFKRLLCVQHSRECQWNCANSSVCQLSQWNYADLSMCQLCHFVNKCVQISVCQLCQWEWANLCQPPITSSLIYSRTFEPKYRSKARPTWKWPLVKISIRWRKIQKKYPWSVHCQFVLVSKSFHHCYLCTLCIVPEHESGLLSILQSDAASISAIHFA